MSNQTTYIIILNYNGYLDTIECLQSIYKSNYLNYKIILIDNNSSDNSINFLEKWFTKMEIDFTYNINETDSKKDVLIVSLNKNSGYSAGNNVGIRLAVQQKDCQYIWILNNDTLINENTLNNIIKSANKSSKNTILGNKVLYANGKIQSIGGRLNRKFLFTRHNWMGETNRNKIFNLSKLDYIPGCSIFLNASLINLIGFLPENYFMFYEDVDFCINAQKKGINLQIVQDSVIVHKEGSSVRREKIEYISFINRIKFCKKNFPNKLKYVYMGIMYQIFKNIFLLRWNFVYKLIANLKQ